ncbi:MAG: ribosomal-processing cysteine protease Prp [Spirochaetes bacterium]|nr:ribosomal-processing cysteine protease Prp [Spirochaetota bacterium]
MIRVEVAVKQGAFRRIDVSGHGGGKKGKDIVCAAVSAVTQTALLGLLRYGEEHVTYRTEEGSLSIEILPSEEDCTQKSFSAILTTMVLGLQAIEKEHPDRLRVELLEI